MEREFDTIVIGAGPAGEVAAGRIASRGEKRVALVEGHLIGGECSFYACMPSKALLRPAEALHEIRRVPGAAQAATGSLDVPAALARRDEVIHGLDDSSQLPWVEEHGISLFRGFGRLDGERRVRVGDERLLARDAVVLAVGTGALMPPIPGLSDVDAWTNREVTTASEAPRRLIILGGGFVGVEMAQAWSALGSEVTVIEAEDRLITREEPVASDAVRDGLQRAGVQLELGVRAAAVTQDGEQVSVQLSDGRSVAGDRLLVAIGRKPRTEELGLESVGLEGGREVVVDDHLRVEGLPWLYAVGDVNGRSLLTHSGKYQARIAADCILGGEAVAWADLDRAPRVVFTEPQVAAVGLTVEQANAQGIETDVIDLETNGSAGGSFYGRGTAGTTRFVVDVAREIVLGVTFVGIEVHEFVQAATFAIVAEIPISLLAHGLAVFPTRSEIWLKFVEAYEKQRGRSVHVVR